MEKVKKIAKYTVNTLNMINALIISLSPIWDWHLDNITKTIIAIAGVISLYLVSGKLFSLDDEAIQTTLNEDSIEELGGEAENVISSTEETTKEKQ